MDSDNWTPGEFQVGDETQPRTLYVGNLDTQMTEQFLVVLFSQLGSVKNCKIIHEVGGDPYAFVEFLEHQAASAALIAMNKRSCFGREIKVNWATSPNNQFYLDRSKHYHVFVGDLSQEVKTQPLRDAFAPFGEISDCRVVRDPQTLKSKGYGFVSFVKKSEAEAAIAAMNGQWLGNRSIRTNWASRRPPPPTKGEATGSSRQLTSDKVYSQTSPGNCTVYCGGIMNGLSDSLIQETFSPYGQIQQVRVFKDKGYAFIRYATKWSATRAITALHNKEVNGQIVRCSWGKETGEAANLPSQLSTQQYDYGSVAGAQYPYYDQAQQRGYYWYPQGYPGATAQAQMQDQFSSGMQMQGYSSYGNYGYSQGFMGNSGANMQGMMWGQGMTGTPMQNTAATQQMTGSALHRRLP